MQQVATSGRDRAPDCVTDPFRSVAGLARPHMVVLGRSQAAARPPALPRHRRSRARVCNYKRPAGVTGLGVTVTHYTHNTHSVMVPNTHNTHGIKTPVSYGFSIVTLPSSPTAPDTHPTHHTHNIKRSALLQCRPLDEPTGRYCCNVDAVG